LIVLGLWTLYGVSLGLNSYFVRASLGRPIPFEISISLELLYTTLWALLTPVIVLLARRFPITKQTWHTGVAVQIAGLICLGMAQKLLWELLGRMVAPTFFGPLNLKTLVPTLAATMDTAAMLYLFVVASTYAVSYYKSAKEQELRASRLEGQLMQSQLMALKAQLHPHFLFNTLNTISALVREEPEAAERMIARLSDLLRSSLENVGAQEVSLRKELDLVQRYLDIQQVRFEDRLRVNFEIDPGTLDAVVPNLLLQPLVENAIRHGLADRLEGGELAISAHRMNGSLRLAVRDNGCGLPGDSMREGVGLSNTRARLRQLYGDAQEIELRNLPPGGAEVIVTIPFHGSPSTTAAG